MLKNIVFFGIPIVYQFIRTMLLEVPTSRGHIFFLGKDFDLLFFALCQTYPGVSKSG